MFRVAMIAAVAVAALVCPGSRADDPPIDTSPAARFAELKARFVQREKAFYDELAAARKLKGADSNKKIQDENDAFRADRRTLDAELRALLAAHPADPAALDGMITLVDTMRSPLDDAQLKIIRERFMNDPRMGKLCAALAFRYGPGIRKLLADVADQHPDRAVRGQANYTLGMSWRSTAEIVLNPPRDPKEVETDLANARKYFTRAAEEFGDAMSADGRFRIGAYARAELARIENRPNLKVGKPAPEINGKDLDGNPLRLSDHRGKVVVVVFWATWCGPCMAMVPHERELIKRMEGKPFALLGVNSDMAEDREKARQATKEKGMTWPSWWDGDLRGPIQTAYNVPQWPTVYVIDPAGIIRHIDVQGAALDHAVDELMAESDKR